MASTMTGGAFKRRRTEVAPDWTLAFDDASSLRNVMEAVATVVQKVVFRIMRTDSTYMLAFDGNDTALTCFITSRLHIDKVTFSDNVEERDEFSFCVNCRHLLIAIDSPFCSRGTLIMHGYGDKVEVHMHDPNHPSDTECSTLNTFVDTEEQPISLKDMEFDMIIEIKVAKLKAMIRKAGKLHAEHLRIRVHLSANGSKQYSCVVFSVDGDAYYSQTFQHETSWHEDGSLRVHTADGPVNNGTLYEIDDVPAFDGTFPTDMIDAFVKIIPSDSINAAIGTDMPLCITHKLGGGTLSAPGTNDASFIRFVIAPKQVTE